MLKTTTKTETGRELEMWLEGKDMMANLEGMIKGNKFYETERQYYKVINCGVIDYKGEQTEIVVKINDDIREFINRADEEIKEIESEERNSELTIKIIETKRSGAWITQNLVMELEDKLLSKEQQEQLRELESILGTIALFAGAGEHIKANGLSVEKGQKYTLSELMAMLKETEKYQAKIEAEVTEEERVNEAKEEAKEEARETGENVKINNYLVECNNSNEECSTDIITVYMTPSGRTKTERIHTY